MSNLDLLDDTQSVGIITNKKYIIKKWNKTATDWFPNINKTDIKNLIPSHARGIYQYKNCRFKVSTRKHSDGYLVIIPNIDVKHHIFKFCHDARNHISPLVSLTQIIEDENAPVLYQASKKIQASIATLETHIFN